MGSKTGCGQSTGQRGFVTHNRFCPGCIRKAIFTSYAYSYPWSMHFFQILCRCNRTENYYFSKCTNLIIFQMKLWLRLLAGKTKYQHIICAVSVAIKSPRTPVWSATYTQQKIHSTYTYSNGQPLILVPHPNISKDPGFSKFWGVPTSLYLVH